MTQQLQKIEQQLHWEQKNTFMAQQLLFKTEKWNEKTKIIMNKQIIYYNNLKTIEEKETFKLECLQFLQQFRLICQNRKHTWKIEKLCISIATITIIFNIVVSNKWFNIYPTYTWQWVQNNIKINKNIKFNPNLKPQLYLNGKTIFHIQYDKDILKLNKIKKKKKKKINCNYIQNENSET